MKARPENCECMSNYTCRECFARVGPYLVDWPRHKVEIGGKARYITAVSRKAAESIAYFRNKHKNYEG